MRRVVPFVMLRIRWELQLLETKRLGLKLWKKVWTKFLKMPLKVLVECLQKGGSSMSDEEFETGHRVYVLKE